MGRYKIYLGEREAAIADECLVSFMSDPDGIPEEDREVAFSAHTKLREISDRSNRKEGEA